MGRSALYDEGAAAAADDIFLWRRPQSSSGLALREIIKTSVRARARARARANNDATIVRSRSISAAAAVAATFVVFTLSHAACRAMSVVASEQANEPAIMRASALARRKFTRARGYDSLSCVVVELRSSARRLVKIQAKIACSPFLFVFFFYLFVPTGCG